MVPVNARHHAGEDTVARVVGLVDEPDLQRVTPLTWHPADGPWLLVGGSGSGRTTALRAIALAASAVAGPESLHLQVIDPHGSLGDLAALPHLGTSARSSEHRACAALVRHLRGEVDRRLRAAEHQPATAEPTVPPTILVLVDGWDQLVEAQPAHDPDLLTNALLRVLRDGRAVGVVGAVSGGHSLLRPRWGGVAGSTFLLGSVDPLDAALAGLRAADVPHDPPTGRAVRVHDRREVQFAHARPDDTSAVAPAAGPPPAAGVGPWRWTALPSRVRRTEVSRGPGGEAADGHLRSLLLGVGGDRGTSCCWSPDTDGRRLLVAGPPRSGRTNALRVVTESLCAQGRFVVVLCSETDAGRLPWAPGAVVLGTGDVAELVRLRRAHPDLALCVDDADRLGDGDLLVVLREIVGLVDRDGGLVAVSTSTTALAARFSGIDVEVARHGLRRWS